MSTIEVRNNFHQLIDKINNDKILSKFYGIMKRASELKDGQLWEKLTKVEQNELLLIDDETNIDTKLISNSKIQEKHRKWFLR